MVEATWLFPQHAGLLVAVDVVEFWLVFSSALFLFMSYLPPRIALGQVAARGYTKGLAMGETSGAHQSSPLESFTTRVIKMFAGRYTQYRNHINSDA